MTNSRLRELVNHYKKNFRPRRQFEARFSQMSCLKEAIRVAALALREDGKMESHQRRVGSVALSEFEETLQEIRRQIAGCKKFDDLYDVLYENRTDRIGPLTVYDTAIRIAAYLGLQPESVYLHAGARVGANNLGLSSDKGKVAMEDIPEPLKKLTSDEIEDFLCIYKKCLSQDNFSLMPRANSCLPMPMSRRGGHRC